VGRAIASLPDDARRTLELREIDGLSYQEIAEALSIPRGTVMSRLHYARRRLQQLLRDAGVDPFDLGGGAEDGT
jgi:RNA polymerase sigma-70 factor (ECF subfamily)